MKPFSAEQKERRRLSGIKFRTANPGYCNKWRREHKESMRLSSQRSGHKTRYKEPYENKQKRLEEQGFRCANPGCRTTDPGPKGWWHTDHDHETGKVRGELCGSCNVALGLLKDNEFRAEGLAEYIRRHKVNGRAA